MQASPMIERVALGVRRQRFERNGWARAYHPDVPLHETELADARAAIEAMLPATEEMLFAGFRVNKFKNPRPCGPTCVGRVTLPVDKVWQAMLRAALEEI